jgi:hypothetical protein
MHGYKLVQRINNAGTGKFQGFVQLLLAVMASIQALHLQCDAAGSIHTSTQVTMCLGVQPKS